MSKMKNAGILTGTDRQVRVQAIIELLQTLHPDETRAIINAFKLK